MSIKTVIQTKKRNVGESPVAGYPASLSFSVPEALSALKTDGVSFWRLS